MLRRRRARPKSFRVGNCPHQCQAGNERRRRRGGPPLLRRVCGNAAPGARRHDSDGSPPTDGRSFLRWRVIRRQAIYAPRPLAGQESVLLFCSWASPDTAADVWLTSTMIIIQPSSPDPVGNCLAPDGQANPGPWRGSESRPLAGSKQFGCLVRVAKEWTTRLRSCPAPQRRSPSIAQSFISPTVRQPDGPSAWQSGLAVWRSVSLSA